MPLTKVGPYAYRSHLPPLPPSRNHPEIQYIVLLSSANKLNTCLIQFIAYVIVCDFSRFNRCLKDLKPNI